LRIGQELKYSTGNGTRKNRNLNTKRNRGCDSCDDE